MQPENSTVIISFFGKRILIFLSCIFMGIHSNFGQCSMTCFDEIQVSLNQNCEARVTYRMILPDGDNPYVCNPNGPSAYKIVVMDEEGVPIPSSPIITCEYIGRTLTAKAEHWFSGNSCWSTIIVEDKLPPIIDVEDATILCNQNIAPVSEGGDIPTPTVSDACADSCGTSKTLFFEDIDITKFLCEDELVAQGIVGRIERSWTACDESNNCINAIQIITIRQPALSEFVFPPSFVGAMAFDCQNGCDPFDLTCTGQPTLEGGTIDGTFCNIAISFEDEIINFCEGSFEVVRNWTIQDTCSMETVQQEQIIDVIDGGRPIISCPDDFSPSIVQVNPNPFSCGITVVIPAAEVSDNCSSLENIRVNTIVLRVDELTGERIMVDSVVDANGSFTLDLEFGMYEVYYEATDNCGNFSSNIDNPCSFTLVDEVPPSPVCNALTKLSLDSEGRGIIFAGSFDSGSFDNCCIDRFEVRRMSDETGEFSEFVEFSCEDALATEPLLVILRVIDCEGNFSECMVEVLIDDKTPPVVIECPAPTTIFCSENLSLEEVQAQLPRPIAEDFCGGELVFTSSLVEDNRNECGEGDVVYEWDIFDASGNGPVKCEHIVTFVDDTPISITFPGDFISFICKDPSQLAPEFTGTPTIEGADCEMVEVVFFDSPIEGDTSCTSFMRTWIVSNNCASEEEAIVNEHIQTIDIMDIEAPVLDCGVDEIELCLGSEVCSQSFFIAGIIATDCSQQVAVSAEWTFTSHEACDAVVETGMVEDAGDGFDTPMIGPGQLEVRFFATDVCGNESTCVRSYTINDCTAPEVVCLPGITLTLDDKGQVEVWASDFHEEIIDNCSDCDNIDYVFSFSQDTSEQVRVFDCDGLGVQTAQIWITDAFGNQDFCTVTYVIKGEEMCPDKDGGIIAGGQDEILKISGNISKEDGTAVEAVDITANDYYQEMMDKVLTDESGQYNLSFQRSAFLSLLPFKDDEPLNGVSTFDVLQLRRYILGYVSFDSPYKLIAADINHSNSITIADVVELRRVVLRLTEGFPNNTSWRFIKADYVFDDPQNPFLGEMPEYATIQELKEEMEVDFIAIKIGDLNGNAQGRNQFNTQVESRNSSTVKLSVKGDDLRKGDITTIDFSLNRNDLQSLQFTLQFDPNTITLLDIPSNTLVSADNFGTKLLSKGILTMSWEEPLENQPTLSFQLKVRANSTVALNEAFSISSKVTPVEVTDNQGNYYGLRLDFDEHYRFQLFQNQPNPFHQQTVIRFSLPDASPGVLSIFDISGKELYTRKGDFVKGLNEVPITDIDELGVIYYQLDTKYGSKQQKMIRVE